MLFIRSALFNFCFFILTPICSLMVLLFRPFGFSASWFWAKLWSRSMLGLARILCGIKVEIEGQEHFPDEACVVMAKHQSAMETIAMPMLVPAYAWILKRELFYIPIFGWALAAIGAIAIRRGNPREAIKQVIAQGKQRLAENRWVVIFPEGTRSAIGTTGNYQPGGVIVAQKAGAAILPMAHNAGAHWPKRGFTKTPGTVTFRFLPLIDAETVTSTKRNELLQRLEADIEAETRNLGG
ncbi:MAG TPA: lysophospholipid acyltransferase family protein [Mariprofundaceae bacterium]|nr:lysophospholipid acyltransferase family protein [Mariprofundaceae bacterium]